MSEYILQMKQVSKLFPGIKALDAVDFNVRPGEIHALIGENGAGKSTLIKILTGVYIPSSGSIIYQGEDCRFSNALDAQKAGIAAIHQEASMFPELSVMENIYMGHHLSSGKYGKLDWRSMRHKTRKLLDRMDLDINPDTLVKNLCVAQRHMVEIAKALSIEARVVIMDEPTSALTLREVADLFKIVRNLKEEGKAVIFISHKFEEIYEICEYFTVLRDGKYIGEGRVSDHSIDDMVRMMVGRSLDQLFPKTDAVPGETVLEVDNLTRAGFFKDISFSLRRGEILGFFGLIGAGRTEVMRCLFGIDDTTSGSATFKGKTLDHSSPGRVMEQGISYVPEDRQDQGVILEMSLSHNITLPIINRISRFGVIDHKQEREETEKYGTMMEVKSAGWHVNANTLSGGNQQKIVLAKWLATSPEMLILDEPTKGIDVGSKAVIHQFVSRLASEGKAVILISSELQEVMGMADRIIVMHEGRYINTFDRDEFDSDSIIKAATGHDEGGRAV